MPSGVTGPLVERDAELAALVDALARPPSLVVVEGEPGIGKTRLVREALATPALRGRQVLVGETRPVRDPFPLGPLVEAVLGARLPAARELSPIVGALRGLLPERAADLPPAPDPIDDPHVERHRVVRALLELLRALGPAVLVMEDVHWADDRTVELVRLLAAAPPAELSVVLTYRSADVASASPLRGLVAGLPTALTTRIEVPPLSTQGVADLAAGLLGAGTIAPELASDLSERTGGVPFVVEEDIRLLQERRLVSASGGVWQRLSGAGSDVPQAVGEAVVERAGGLPAEGQAIVQAAAVVGGPADDGMLGAVTGLDPERTAAGLSAALAAGLLREVDGRAVFRHALARAAVYDAIPSPQRRRLHLAAANALDGPGADPGVMGRLAHHYSRAGRTADWARCAEAAAAVASSIGEEATAYRYLRELLDAGAVPSGRRAELTAKLAWVTPMGHQEREATSAFLYEALAQPGLEAPLRGQLRLLLGWNLVDEPETAAVGFGELRAAVGDLGERPGLQARALATLAAPSAPDATLAERLGYLEAATAAARRASNPAVHAGVAADTAWVLMAAGDPRAWQALEALPAPSTSAKVNRQLLRGLNNVADSALDLGHYVRARELAVRGLRLASELHSERLGPLLECVELLARWWMGETDGVEREAERLRREENVQLSLEGDLLSGEILFARGAFEEAERVLSAVAVLQRQQGELSRAARASTALVRIALGRGDRAAARDIAAPLFHAEAARQSWVRVAHLIPFSPLDLVREILPEYRTGVAGRDAPLAIAALAFAEGRIAEDEGDRVAAAAAYAGARERFAAMSDPRLAAHAAEADGRCRTALRESTGAERYGQAWRTFVDLDAPWEANRVKHAMRVAGWPVPHRRGRRSYGERLSPREREVAELAAAGRTNREIGEQLFLSPRTVDSHVASILRKLDIASRRQLAGALPEPGQR